VAGVAAGQPGGGAVMDVYRAPEPHRCVIDAVDANPGHVWRCDDPKCHQRWRLTIAETWEPVPWHEGNQPGEAAGWVVVLAAAR
jgi:hypothetical protein